MSDDEMRRELLRKLSDPEWKARQAHRYSQIVGEAEIEFQPAPSRARPTRIEISAPLPREEMPGTVDALWMGNWQRSAGALNITRFPDDTVVLETPTGERTLYRPCAAPKGRHSWLSETRFASGRGTDVYRCPDRYEDAQEALLEMHRAALAAYAEMAADGEA